jgi:hypothetical protein
MSVIVIKVNDDLMSPTMLPVSASVMVWVNDCSDGLVMIMIEWCLVDALLLRGRGCVVLEAPPQVLCTESVSTVCLAEKTVWYLSLEKLY